MSNGDDPKPYDGRYLDYAIYTLVGGAVAIFLCMVALVLCLVFL